LSFYYACTIERQTCLGVGPFSMPHSEYVPFSVRVAVTLDITGVEIQNEYPSPASVNSSFCLR